VNLCVYCSYVVNVYYLVIIYPILKAGQEKRDLHSPFLFYYFWNLTIPNILYPLGNGFHSTIDKQKIF
jgi:hypothetical protein